MGHGEKAETNLKKKRQTTSGPNQRGSKEIHNLLARTIPRVWQTGTMARRPNRDKDSTDSRGNRNGYTRATQQESPRARRNSSRTNKTRRKSSHRNDSSPRTTHMDHSTGTGITQQSADMPNSQKARDQRPLGPSAYLTHEHLAKSHRPTANETTTEAHWGNTKENTLYIRELKF